ncbi:MAG: hypothetical protein H3C58_09560 [Fimbriimonadaceae bacterium]|nr:hypothetical protein [Fimbriimonadaceae bacterium]
MISAEVRAAAYPIGFVADVDPHIGLAERWQMLTQPMRNVIGDVPEVIDKSGWLHDDPRVGVWLMPDNEANGAIEDFIRQIKLAGSEALWGYAVESTARSRSFGSTFRDVDCRKAEVHTFLGWQDPPGLRYGEAVSRGCFDHEADLAKRFVSWFKRLYSI